MAYDEDGLSYFYIYPVFFQVIPQRAGEIGRFRISEEDLDAQKLI